MPSSVQRADALWVAVRSGDDAAVSAAMAIMPPPSCWQAVYAAMVGVERVSAEQFKQLLGALPLAGDDGSMMGMALVQGDFDAMAILHARGFVLAPTPDNAKRMLSAMMRGGWPHPDLVFPSLMEMPHQERVWPTLVQQPRTAAPGGLRVAHIERMDALPRTSRAIEGVAEALSTLGWVSDPFEDLFTDPEAYLALARMHQLGWIDRKAALAWNSNSAASATLAGVLDQIEAMAAELSLQQSTPPAPARPVPRRV